MRGSATRLRIRRSRPADDQPKNLVAHPIRAELRHPNGTAIEIDAHAGCFQLVGANVFADVSVAIVVLRELYPGRRCAARPWKRFRVDQTANISRRATRNEKIPSASENAIPMNMVAV